MNLTWYGILMFVSGIVSLGLGRFVWPRRIDAESFWFSLLMHAAAVWALFASFETAVQTPKLKLFFSALSYAGVASVAVLWFLHASRYGSRSSSLRRASIVALWIVPTMIFLSALTNSVHGLLWESVEPVGGAGGLQFRYSPGPLVFVNMVYSYSLLAAGTIRLLSFVLRSPSIFIRQGIVLCAAALVPWLGNVLYMLDVLPLKVDFTPVFFSMTGVLIFLGLVRYRLFDVSPVARDILFRGMEDEVLVVDGAGRVVDMNPSAQKIFKLDSSDLGRPMKQLLSEWPGIAERCETDKDEEVSPMSLETHRGDHWFDVRITPLKNYRGRPVGKLLVFRDISERKKLEEELVKFASLDTLTGVYNRRVGLSILEQQIRFAERNETPLTICFIDINDLKQVNDMNGHAGGDAFIGTIVSVLKETVRESDVLCRLGGDEFLVILPDCSIEKAFSVWERVEEKLEKASRRDGKPIPYTAAHGLAEFKPGSGMSQDEFLSRADAAMYRNKESMKRKS